MFAALSRLSLHRPLASYSKAQKVYSNLIRNRRFQLAAPRVRSLRYLDLGCGPNIHETLINTDYQWLPGVDLCWDVTRGIPLPDASMAGIFTEHALEHFPLPTAKKLLQECRRVMEVGARLRIIVPDAEIYLLTYARRLAGEAGAVFPYEGNVLFEGISSPVLDVNRIFMQDRSSPYGHWFIYDFAFLRALLESVGFVDVARCAYRQGQNPTLLVDSEGRAVESLYVEAVKGSA